MQSEKASKGHCRAYILAVENNIQLLYHINNYYVLKIFLFIDENMIEEFESQYVRFQLRQ